MDDLGPRRNNAMPYYGSIDETFDLRSKTIKLNLYILVKQLEGERGKSLLSKIWKHK